MTVMCISICVFLWNYSWISGTSKEDIPNIIVSPLAMKNTRAGMHRRQNFSHNFIAKFFFIRFQLSKGEWCIVMSCAGLKVSLIFLAVHSMLFSYSSKNIACRFVRVVIWKCMLGGG